MTTSPPPPSPSISRRAFIVAAATAATAAVTLPGSPSAFADAAPPQAPLMTPRITPPIFVAHGAPTLALDPVRGQPLRDWGLTLGAPAAILAISAHWERAPLTVGALDHRRLMYDFSGFPDPLYRVAYPAPAAPDLLPRVSSLLDLPTPPAHLPDRLIDHGVWVPLLHLFPSAQIPLLQVSMPSASGPAALFDLGRRLAPLAAEGVLLMGSGNLVHNLRRLSWDESTPPAAWASEFDDWVAQAILHGDADSLIDFAHRAPSPLLAHPTPDHYLPILVIAGAAAALGASPRFTLDGWEYGNISRRSVQFG
jgi:4,5-DOPA dioxygenase extradiol